MRVLELILIQSQLKMIGKRQIGEEDNYRNSGYFSDEEEIEKDNHPLPLILQPAPAIIRFESHDTVEQFHHFLELPVELRDTVMGSELYKYSLLSKECHVHVTELMPNHQLRFSSISPREICDCVKAFPLYQPTRLGIFDLIYRLYSNYTVTVFDKGCIVETMGDDDNDPDVKKLYYIEQILEFIPADNDGRMVALFEPSFLRKILNRRRIAKDPNTYAEEYIEMLYLHAMISRMKHPDILKRVALHYDLLGEFGSVIDTIDTTQKFNGVGYPMQPITDEPTIDESTINACVVALGEMAKRISKGYEK